MFLDERSVYRRLKDAEYLRGITWRASLIGLGIYALSRRPSPLEPSRLDSINNLFTNVGDRLEDIKHAAVRTYKHFKGEEVKGDPVIKVPWKLYRMNTLPLLPDLLDYKLPKSLPTLVVDMDVLFKDIHYSQGWKLFKRQRLEELLKFTTKHFELIIWSNEKFPLGQTMILGCGISCMGVLHQNNMSYCGGQYYKDLRRLGRDIQRVVRVTTSSQDMLADQADNTIVLDGSRDDCLDGLTNYLKTLSLTKGDLRPKIRECNRQDCIDNYRTRDVTGFLSRLIGLID